MPRIRIPKVPGQFRVVVALSGTYAVVNDKTGKNHLMIPCRDKEHAEEVCRLLNSKERPSELWM